VSLLTSELVTNSVRHGGTTEDVRLDALLADGYAHVTVTDRGPGFDPEVRHEANGFGLRLVDKLASRWGVEHDAGETRVWFEVDRRRRRFDRDSG
jgi:anti-sigma regulatory factor (Ser/Thr protein kinase)